MTAGKKAKSKAVAARGRVQLVEVDPATTSTSQLKWHEQAAFHVTFNNAADQSDGSMWQTRVYHEEAGADCVRSGILAPELIDWMRERAGLPASSEAPRELPSADAEHAHVP